MKPIETKQLAGILLPEAKLWLRRSTDSLNSEVEQTVAACMMDLSVVGVKNINAEDPLIQQAVKFYAKGHFGYDAPDKWSAAYEHLKAALSLNSDYTIPAVMPDG